VQFRTLFLVEVDVLINDVVASIARLLVEAFQDEEILGIDAIYSVMQENRSRT